ncbi:MAG: efflux RND transporter periplasmic adaptor subunit [Deinococcota bacterium]
MQNAKPTTLSARHGLVLLAVAGLLLSGCNNRRGNAEATTATPTQAAPRVTKVRAVTLKEGVLTVSRTAGATLAPLRESNVASSASGKVLAVLVEEGSRVGAGQTVLRLDDATARTAVQNAELALEQARINLERASRSTEGSLAPLQAALQAAQANLQVAQRRYTEGQQLFRVGAIAQVELTGLEAALGQAKSNAENAREALERAQRANREDLALLRVQVQQAEAQLAQARRALADTEVKAPFAGVVAEVYVNPGEFVAAGSRAFRLADVRRLEAKFRIPPSEAAKLAPGTGLNLDYGGQTYFARLSRTSQIPGTDRLVEAVATLQAPLPPGASASVRYTLEIAKGVIAPSGALLPGEQPRVMLVENGMAKAVKVEILGDNGSQLALRGVSAGSQVVFPVPASLRSGDALEVIR